MFKDLSVKQQFITQGFAVINTNLRDETQQLLEFILSDKNFSSSGFYYSLLANTFERNLVIRNTIKKILTNFYHANFTDYRTITESYLSKPAHTSEEFLLHQDWCYTDEKNYPVYNLWIPLNDVTAENGTMFFLPGSHLWFENYRSASLPTGRISAKNFDEGQIKKVELVKGQALLFHPAIFHGSYPNASPANRIVATATIMPLQAPFLYYHQEENSGETEVYLLNDETYLKHLQKIAMKGKPDAQVVKRFAYVHHIITEKELLEKRSEKFINLL